MSKYISIQGKLICTEEIAAVTAPFDHSPTIYKLKWAFDVVLKSGYEIGFMFETQEEAEKVKSSIESKLDKK